MKGRRGRGRLDEGRRPTGGPDGERARPDALWRNRDAVLLWAGQAVSTLGSQVSGLALPLLVLALTGSAAQAGLVGALQTLPHLVFSLPAGALIDRWDRKAVMVRCDIARALAYGSVPLASALGHLTLAQLCAVALVGGTAFVFFNIAQVSALPRVVTPAHLPRANGVNASVDAAAGLLGPGLGGVIIGLARTTISGAALAYLVDGISYVASVLSLLFIRTPFQGERAPPPVRSLRAEIADGLRFLWAHPVLRIIGLLNLVRNILVAPAYLAVIVLARGALHADARAVGLIFGLGSVGGILGSAVAPWATARLRYGRVIVGTVALEALALALLAAAPTPALLVAGWALYTLSAPIQTVTLITYRQAVTPDAVQGRVNGAARLLVFGGNSLGQAAGGLLLGPLGPRAELGLAAAGLGACAVTVGLTRIRRA